MPLSKVAAYQLTPINSRMLDVHKIDFIDVPEQLQYQWHGRKKCPKCSETK